MTATFPVQLNHHNIWKSRYSLLSFVCIGPGNVSKANEPEVNDLMFLRFASSHITGNYKSSIVIGTSVKPFQVGTLCRLQL